MTLFVKKVTFFTKFGYSLFPDAGDLSSTKTS